MLTDKPFRKKIVDQLEDVTVRSFWVNEFAAWNDKFATEAVAPILNKVGAFTANPLIRNVIGQRKSSFDIRQMMDEGKILICDLSRGRLGEDNAATLGALMISKIQLAAMSRANIMLDERRPFYLYVDEFQNFATDSFSVILSEARKYGLYLTVANQYVAQMPQEVRDAVFGNVGSMITFRVGADDATALARYFEPVFEPTDLTNLSLQNVYITMSIDGETSIPFSAKTLRVPDPEQDMTQAIIARSREKYNVSRAEAEQVIREWSGFRPDGEKLADGESSAGERRPAPSDKPAQEPHGAHVGSRPSLQVSGAAPKNYSELITAKPQSNSRPNERSQNQHMRSRKRPARPN